MKKIIIASVMALVAGGASMQAKTADELRIYINPGHGSFTADDRPCQVIGRKAYSATQTDSAGFYESNTDLIKGFGVLEKLIQYGVRFDRSLNQTGSLHQIGAARDLSNNIVMSRVKNGPYYENNLTVKQINNEITKILNGRAEADCTDAEKAQIAKWREQAAATVHYNRNLSEICEEVEANNFDMFISIHSNAASEGSTSNYPLFLYRGNDTHANEFEQTCYNMAKACWPYAYANKHMTWSAYANSMNLRGDIDFYHSSSTGSLGYTGYLGVLKHGTPGFLVEGYFHTYQPARHRAMNDDVNIMEGYEYARGIADYFGLKKESTGDIYGIVRDEHEKFTHKLYTPSAASDDIYLPLNGVTVTLKKDGKEVATRVTDNYYNGAYVFKDIEPGKYTLEFSHADYKAIEPVEVTVTAAGTAYPAVRMENVNYVPPTVTYVTYPDEYNDPAAGPQSAYNFKKVYGDSQIEQLAGKTIKRAVAAGDIVYILALDEAGAPTLLVYDTDKKEVVRVLSTEGTEGDKLALSDIALTADGVLVGINKATGAFNGAAKVNVYKWAANADDKLAEGAPAKWFSTNNVGNYNNAVTGESMAYAGTSTDGSLLYTAVTTASSGALRIVSVTIANGVNAGVYHMNQNKNTNGSEPELGNYQLNISPADDKNFILTSDKAGAAEFVCATAAAGVPTPVSELGDVADKAAYRVQMFKYAGASYMAVASTAEGKNVGVTLVDITAGLKDAKAVKTVNTDIDPAELPGVVAMGQTLVTRDIENNVTDGWMNLYVARAEGVSRFTTKSVDQPVNRAAFAYDLAQTGDSKQGYTLTFKSVADAPEAEIVLTDAEGNETAIAAGAVKKGDNQVTLTPGQLTEKATYTWAVRIKSEANGRAGRVFTSKSPKADNRGGLVFINDTESPNFGKIVVSNGSALGIDLYDAELNHMGNYFKGDSRFNAGNRASTFRAGQRDGVAYIVDWSDKGAGYWMFDPSDPTKLDNFLEGTKNAAGGYVVDGKVIGGGATDVAFVGKGDDCKMVTYVEDIDPGNSLVRYDIGAAKTWGKAPDKFFSGVKSRLANTNVALAATDNGVFACQVRTAGNNIQGTPSFIYVDLEGNELFNSSTLTDLNSGGGGIAINGDRTLLAVGEHQTGISIWNVTWDGNKPSMEKLYTIPGSAVSGGNGEINDIEFDNAGNIYAFYRATGAFSVFALRNDAPEALTAAKTSMVIEGPTSGVEDVIADGNDSDAPVEFFNLQGIRVNADNLTPGIYIRRQGKTSTKVVIR